MSDSNAVGTLWKRFFAALRMTGNRGLYQVHRVTRHPESQSTGYGAQWKKKRCARHDIGALASGRSLSGVSYPFLSVVPSSEISPLVRSAPSGAVSIPFSSLRSDLAWAGALTLSPFTRSTPMNQRQSTPNKRKNTSKSTKTGPRRNRTASAATGRVVHPRAAGIDIGSTEHYVAVPGKTKDEPLVKSFGCYTPQLHEMAQWLHAHKITTVAIESTGVYWVPVMDLLESEGLEVILVNPEGLKQIKTDVKDCRALQHLHSLGLLRGSFRPSQEIVALRAYCRQRAHLVAQSSQQIQLMQKALEQMNIQLHKAISDLSGATGMRILHSILNGQYNPEELAKLRHGAVKTSQTDLAKALTGNYRPEHLFSLRQAVQAYEFFQRQIQLCDEQIDAHMCSLPGAAPDCKPTANSSAAGNGKTPRRRKNQFYFDARQEQIRLLGVDLTKIPGISTLTVQTILSEVGTDLTKFPTAKHFASWLGLCPNNRKTGGRVRSTRTRPVSNRLATALRLAAQSLERSQTSLGGFYRRLKARKGPAKAITATAHKLAVLVYRMITKGQSYVELGLDYYEQQYRNRILQNLTKRARAFGYELLPIPPSAIVS